MISAYETPLQHSSQWFKENEALIWMCVHRHYPAFENQYQYSKEDLFQIACLEIWNISNAYLPQKNVKFATYAIHCINNRFNEEKRNIFAEKRITNALSLEACAVENPSLFESFIEENGSIDTQFLIEETKRGIFDLIQEMHGSKAYIFWQVLFGEITQERAAKLLGCSQGTVSNHKNKIQSKILENIKNNEL